MAQTIKQKAEVKKLQGYVNNGVKVLDEKFGRRKWLKGIDLKTLDLGEYDVCICGQMFGEFWDAQFKGFNAQDMRDTFDKKGSEESEQWAIKHGFYADDQGHGNDNYATYDMLTNLWYIKIVTLRIEAGLIP